MAATEPRTAARRVRGRGNQLRALELRKAGLTFQQIADQLGIRKQSAHEHVTVAMERLRAESDQAVRELVALEAARLDQLQAGLWRDAVRGDVPAVTAVLRVMERRARLLGLDADPNVGATGQVTVEVSWPDPNPQQQPEPVVVEGTVL